MGIYILASGTIFEESAYIADFFVFKQTFT